jgi:7-carboxy-7-deazaguanine synthase
MRIAEIYRSFQGEGFLTGTPSVFVRASGCNLRCRFCDTPFASWWPEGEHLTVRQIIDRVEELPAEHVILTGGEPMIFAESVELTTALRQLGRHITIETAGTMFLPVACDLMSISPKLSNSTPSANQDPAWARRHEERRHAPDVIRRLIAEYPYQFKFVVDSPADCREVEQYLAGLREIDRSRVMLMPMGTETAALAETAIWLGPYCAEHGLHYCPRRHVEWFGGVVRGT